MFPGIIMKINNPAAPVTREKENNLRLFKGSERILVVDDEPFLVKAHKMQLTLMGYRVTTSTNSAEALQCIQSDPKLFDLLITDQFMPGFSGVELAKAVQKVNPLLPIILCTGQDASILQKEALSSGISKYVHKPIFRDELFLAIREVLDKNIEKQ